MQHEQGGGRKSSVDRADRPRSGIIKCGWVTKRIKYNIVHPLANRFLCLTTSSILYFHSDAQINDESCADCKIPLNAVTEVSVLDTSSDPQSQEIEIVVNSGTFTTRLVFLCDGIHEGTNWTQVIRTARDQFIAAMAADGQAPAAVTWKRHALNKKIVGKVETIFQRRKHSMDAELLTEEQIVLLMRFGNIIVSDAAIMSSVVEAVLDALNGRHGAELSLVDISKKLGQAVAMWLGADLPEDSQHDPLARQTEMLLLEAWLSIALDRELKRAYTGKADGEAREDTAGHASVMKMPFRGDNCESIFLANFVKGVALKSGTLSDLLQPIVLQIASHPEEYLAEPVMATVQGEADACAETLTPSVDGDGSGGKLHVLSESINDTCSALFQAVATSYDIFPSSMSLLIKAIYEISLDLSAPPMIAVAAVREEATIFPEAVTDDAERLFCTASCGILFLRLLCPALVSPLEWGALREKHRVISASIGMHVSTSSSPMPAYHSSADSKSESPGPATTFFNSVMDFLAIPYAQPGIMPAVTATNTSTDLAWMDPSDDEAKLAMRSVIDIGSCSAALIIIAHVLMASPQVLKILDLKIQSSLGPMSDEMFFPDDETSDGFRAENHKVPKRRSDPLLSLINIKQFVHTRTWSQPTPIEIDQSSESTSVSVLEMIVRNLSNALPISKAEDMLQLFYAAHASLVDSNTEKTMRSAQVRKALVNVAKNVQRVANASCVPESQLESYIAETSPQGKLGGDTASRLNHNFMLSSAVLLKRMYRSIAGNMLEKKDLLDKAEPLSGAAP